MSSIGPTAAVRVCTWRGSRGMSDGSGSRANPWASTEVSKEGLSPNENSTASRAPAASITAVSMVRAVWRKSRSAVSSGPKSASASTVRKSFLRLVPCNASSGGTCEKPEPHQGSIGSRLDCWLVWCDGASGHRVIGSSFPVPISDQPIIPCARSPDRRLARSTQKDTGRAFFFDRRAEMTHNSSKSPAPLVFCRIRPATD